MGIILEFRRSEEAAVRIARPVEGSLGEIIIFPGVRIDRRAPGERPSRPARRVPQAGPAQPKEIATTAVSLTSCKGRKRWP